MKTFKEPPGGRHQVYFLPPVLDDVVPAGAPARILSDAVDKMDCSGLVLKYRGGGAPAYHPVMLLKVLLQAYSEGIRSSRRIEERCIRDTYYMFLTEMSRPDHGTICRFRRNNEAAIRKLFLESVRLCQEAGLVLLEHVAVDGTKLEACVSRKETYNKERAEKAIAYTQLCIDNILKEAEAADAADERKQADGNDDAPPGSGKGSAQGKKGLVAKLKRRKARAEAAKKDMEDSGRNAACATDTESRVMKTASGNRPAYNAQAAVDGANLVIVAANVTQDTNDGRQIRPVLTAAIENTGHKPQRATADCGYNTPDSLGYLDESGIDGYIAEREDQKVKAEYLYDPSEDTLTRPATGDAEQVVLHFHGKRTKDGVISRVYRSRETGKEVWVGEDVEREMRLRGAMHAKLTSHEGKAIYSLRQQIVEPVFGRIKEVTHLRRLLLRGLKGATIEYQLACAAHNMRKLITAQGTRMRYATAG